MSEGPGADDFDRYCEERQIQPGEEPAAFAAWLAEQTGWEGRVVKVDEDQDGGPEQPS